MIGVLRGGKKLEKEVLVSDEGKIGFSNSNSILNYSVEKV